MSELRRIRIGTDITMSVSLSDSDIRMSWDGVNVKHVVLYSDDQKVQAGRGEYSVPPDTPELMKVVYGAGQQCYLGAYRLVVQFSVPVEGGEDRTYTADVPAFELVATTDEVRNIPGESGDDDVVGLHLNLESIDSSLVQELISACINATEDALQTAAEVKETDETVKGNEKDRVEAEEVRVSNEQQRILNEEARARAERLRAEAENGRSEAEKGRVSAEEGRKSAEEGRVKAEADRAEAELKRQTDTAAAIEAANKAAEAANDAASNVDSDQIVPRLRQLEEEVPNKVDKVEGKGLSTNDYTDEDKEKLSGLSNYDDSGIKQQLADKQDALVSGENIKTVNGESLLGPGDMAFDLSPYLKTEDAAQTYLTKTEASSTYATKDEVSGAGKTVYLKGLLDMEQPEDSILTPEMEESMGVTFEELMEKIEDGYDVSVVDAAVLQEMDGEPLPEGVEAARAECYPAKCRAAHMKQGSIVTDIIMIEVRLTEEEDNSGMFPERAPGYVYTLQKNQGIGPGDGKFMMIDSMPAMFTASSIADDLTTDSADKALSARQGKVLDGKITAQGGRMDTIEEYNVSDFVISDYIQNNDVSGSAEKKDKALMEGILGKTFDEIRAFCEDGGGSNTGFLASEGAPVVITDKKSGSGGVLVFRFEYLSYIDDKYGEGFRTFWISYTGTASVTAVQWLGEKYGPMMTVNDLVSGVNESSQSYYEAPNTRLIYSMQQSIEALEERVSALESSLGGAADIIEKINNETL